MALTRRRTYHQAVRRLAPTRPSRSTPPPTRPAARRRSPFTRRWLGVGLLAGLALLPYELAHSAPAPAPAPAETAAQSQDAGGPRVSKATRDEARDDARTSKPKALAPDAAKRGDSGAGKTNRGKPHPQRTAHGGGDTLQIGGPDASRMPSMGHPTVQRAPVAFGGARLSGWADAWRHDDFTDRRQRPWAMPVANDFGETLKIGERFAFDVTFAGNPAGQVEAKVAAVERDPRGPYPRGSDLVRIEGHVISTGVVSMLSTVTADVATWVDLRTGASVKNRMDLKRSGLGAAYKHRVTTTRYDGRGRVEIVDDIDGKVRKFLRNLPADTLDDLAIMAWVRSLALDEGERAVAHVLDGKVLMRMEVVGRGNQPLDPMPGIVTALGVQSADIRLLEGTLTRVDEWDAPLEGKRVYQFRAWVTSDPRRLVLRLESDMWLGVIRLSLAAYDPPSGDAASSSGP